MTPPAPPPPGNAAQFADVTDIAHCVHNALERYFHDLGSEKTTNLYDMVIKSVESPLLEAVLAKTGNNQSLAAEMLGLHRNTLRKKILEHKLLSASD
ncbi:MAG: Fis family transcriptional regulator [Zoogloeaceae bacterium]|jgi:Fis family transcriptional regulator|nr:Fis family transcriptional regulator [Zoogloeaceae bacterium]